VNTIWKDFCIENGMEGEIKKQMERNRIIPSSPHPSHSSMTHHYDNEDCPILANTLTVGQGNGCVDIFRTRLSKFFPTRQPIISQGRGCRLEERFSFAIMWIFKRDPCKMGTPGGKAVQAGLQCGLHLLSFTPLQCFAGQISTPLTEMRHGHDQASFCLWVQFFLSLFKKKNAQVAWFSGPFQVLG